MADAHSMADAMAWLFQMNASVCWAASVFVYGTYEPGDVLQLVAALSWTAANLASLVPVVMKQRGRRGARDQSGTVMSTRT